MITLFDTCPPSTTFLILYFSTLLIISFHYFTQPVQPYCVRKSRPDDCGEKRKDYFIHVLILSGMAFLWTWILNIVFHAVSSLVAWILVFLPFVAIVLWYGYYFLPVHYSSIPVGKTTNHFIDLYY